MELPVISTSTGNQTNSSYRIISASGQELLVFQCIKPMDESNEDQERGITLATPNRASKTRRRRNCLHVDSASSTVDRQFYWCMKWQRRSKVNHIVSRQALKLQRCSKLYTPYTCVYIYILVAQASIFSVYAIGTAYTRPSDLTSLNQLYRFVVGVCTTCITGVLMKQIHLASAPSLWWIEHHPSCLDAGKVIGITTVKASSTVNSSARGVEEGLLQSLRPNSSHIMSVCVSVIQPFCQHLSISSASTC